MLSVPFIDIRRSLFQAPDRKIRILNAWSEVLDEADFVGGKRVAQFEKLLGVHTGGTRAVACANGTDALVIALAAQGIRTGDRVALPNVTFWATYEAIAQLGAIPVLIDIDSSDLQLDFEELKTAHERYRLRAVLLPHLYGWATHKLAEMRAYCAAQEITLIEDGAQCFGVKVAGKNVFEGAVCSTLSFYPAKVFGGAMDGGAILLSDAEAEGRVRSLANHGRSSHYGYSAVGWNSRMGGLQAAFLLEILPEIDSWIGERLKALEAYRVALADVAGVTLHLPPAGIRGNGYLAVLELDQPIAQAVSERMKNYGIGCGRVYPSPLSEQPPARDAIRHGDLSRSRSFCERVLNLPLFPGITPEEIQASVKAFRQVMAEAVSL